MTHPHSGADDAIAKALANEVRNQSMAWDFNLLAESAMDAVLDYEEQINDEYMRTHPNTAVAAVGESRASLARRIRDIKCPYAGTEGIAFREARDKAARLVESA